MGSSLKTKSPVRWESAPTGLTRPAEEVTSRLSMTSGSLLLIALCAVTPKPLTRRAITFANSESATSSARYSVHIPPSYDSGRPTPVVLVFHSAMMNGDLMARLCGLSEKADRSGFVVVYANGTGSTPLFLYWDAGGVRGRVSDDVGYVAKLLDDLATVVNVDPKRVFATGMSNGAMMCYRLAAELSDRIAAIAAVAGTMAIEDCRPRRPVPVLHFHGTKDGLVLFGGPDERTNGPRRDRRPGAAAARRSARGRRPGRRPHGHRAHGLGRPAATRGTAAPTSCSQLDRRLARARARARRVLDAAFAERVRPWPQILLALLRRAARRAERPRRPARDRLPAAARGAPGAAAVAPRRALGEGRARRHPHLALPLTHRLLGQLVGAERPSVSHALASSVATRGS